jgi:hypothetical protein
MNRITNLTALAILTVIGASRAQTIIVNSDGTHSHVHNHGGGHSVVIGSDGSSSLLINAGTNHSIRINPDGSHSVIVHHGPTAIEVTPPPVRSNPFFQETNRQCEQRTDTSSQKMRMQKQRHEKKWKRMRHRKLQKK